MLRKIPINTNILCLIMSKKTKFKAVNKGMTATLNEHDNAIHLDKSSNIILRILAKPGAKQNGIIGISSEGVSIQINAPPTEGEANTELVKYIASVLELKKSEVLFDRGFKSRIKTLRIIGNITVDEVKRKIIDAIS